MMGDQITSNICSIPCSQFLISFVPNIAIIRIGLNAKMIVALIDESFPRSAIDVPEDHNAPA